MDLPFFDLGIHWADISEQLLGVGIAKIVGFARSGKSTLAEILTSELRRQNYEVLLQNATDWIRGPFAPSRIDGSLASIDPELSEAVLRLEQRKPSCWIIDDADVMLAYATAGMLRSIAAKIQGGAFLLLLIRNRFVHEHAGWLFEREALLSSAMAQFWLGPLPQGSALEAAMTLCHGPTAGEQAVWLARMSGGIPGLMSELARYAAAAIDGQEPPGLRLFADRNRQRLKLDEPRRAAIVRAIEQRILPPPALLEPDASDDLGALMSAGMVHPDYAMQSEAYLGDFWRLVSGDKFSPVQAPEEFVAIALELEVDLQRLGLRASLLSTLGLESSVDAALVYVFALSLTCQQEFPGLVRALNAVLAENLGAFRIAELLKQRGEPVDPSMDAAASATRLLTPPNRP